MTGKPHLRSGPASVTDGAGAKTTGGNAAGHDGDLLALLPAWCQRSGAFSFHGDHAHIILIVGQDTPDQTPAAD
mgnify:CR=1 FL=1